MKRMLLTYALALFAVVGISAQEWCRTLATGTTGEQITHDVNGTSVTQYRAETALIQNAGATGVRYTVMQTGALNQLKRVGPCFAIGEIFVLGAAGDTIDYTVTSNAGHNELTGSADGAGLPAVNDGNLNNFFHTVWYDNYAIDEYHYLELTFEKSVDAFQLVWYTRPNQHQNRPLVIGLTNPGVTFTEDMLFAEYGFEPGEQVTDASEFANGGTFTLYAEGPEDLSGFNDYYYYTGNGNTYIALNNYSTGKYHDATPENLVQFIPASNGKFVLYQPVSATYYANPDHWTDGYNGKNGWLRAYSEGWTLAEFEITQRADGDFEITTYITRQYVDGAWVDFEEPLKVWVGYDARGNLKIFDEDHKNALELEDYTQGFPLPVDFGFTIYNASVNEEMVPNKNAAETCSEVLANILNVATEKKAEYADYLGYDWDGGNEALDAALVLAEAAIAEGDLATAFAAKKEIELALATFVSMKANYYRELFEVAYAEVEGNLAEPPYTQEDAGKYNRAAMDYVNSIEGYLNDIMYTENPSYSFIEGKYAQIDAALEKYPECKIYISSFPDVIADIPADNFPYAELSNNAVWKKEIALTEATRGIRLTFLDRHIGTAGDGGNFPMIALGEFKLYDAYGNEVTLTESNFYANHTETMEGFESTVARLCDGNFGAQGYYHSPWSGAEPQEYIYLDVTFPNAMESFSIELYSRDKSTSGGRVSLFPKKVAITNVGEAYDPLLYTNNPYNVYVGEKVVNAANLKDGGLYVIKGLLNTQAVKVTDEYGYIYTSTPEGKGMFYHDTERFNENAAAVRADGVYRFVKNSDGTFKFLSLGLAKYWPSTTNTGFVSGTTTYEAEKAANINVVASTNVEGAFVMYEYVDGLTTENTSGEGETTVYDTPYVMFLDRQGGLATRPVTDPQPLKGNDVIDAMGDALCFNKANGEGEWEIYEVSIENPDFFYLTNLTAVFDELGIVEGTDPGEVSDLGNLEGVFAEASRVVADSIYADAPAAAAALAKEISAVGSFGKNPMVPGFYQVVSANKDFMTMQGVEKALYANAWQNGTTSFGWKNIDPDYRSFYFEFIKSPNAEELVETGIVSEENKDLVYQIRVLGAAEGVSPHYVGETDRQSTPIELFSDMGSDYIILNTTGSAFAFRLAGMGSGFSIHANQHAGGTGQSGNIVYWDAGAGASQWYLRSVDEEMIPDQMEPEPGTEPEPEQPSADTRIRLIEAKDMLKSIVDGFDGNQLITVAKELVYMVEAEIDTYTERDMLEMINRINNTYNSVKNSIGLRLPSDKNFAITDDVHTLQFELYNSISNFTGFQCNVYLPDGFKIATDEYGDYIVTLNRERVTSSHTIVTKKQNDGSYMIACYSSNNALIKGEDGIMFNIGIEAEEGVSLGDYTISCNNIILSTNEAKEFMANGFQDTFRLVRLFDTNKDGIVNEDDIETLAYYLIGKRTDSFDSYVYDVDHNGTIEIKDLHALVDCVQGDTVVLEDGLDILSQRTQEISSFIGDECAMPHYLDYSGELTAFTSIIMIPAICDIAKDENGYYDIRLTERATESHRILSYPRGSVGDSYDGISTHNIIVYSTKNEPLNGNSGAIYNVYLKPRRDENWSSNNISVTVQSVCSPGGIQKNYNGWSLSSINLYKPADANRDNVADSTDLHEVASALAGESHKWDSLARFASDLNKDNDITIIDVAAMADAIRNGYIKRDMNILPDDGSLTLEIGNDDTTLKSKINLPLSIKGTHEVTAIQFDLRIYGNSTIESIELGGSAAETHNCKTRDIDSLRRVVIYSENNDVINDNFLTLTINGNRSVGNSIVELINIKASTATFDEYRAGSVNTVLNFYKSGDASGDGIITIADVVLTVNALLGNIQSNFVFDAADMNGDGEITISDVVSVVNVLLNDDSGEESEIPSGSIGIGDDVDNAVTNAPINRGLSALHVDNVAVENNEATMAVKLDNADRYTAMQFDMALPEGVSIKEVTMNGKHTVSHNGSRVVAYSLTNRAFDNDEDIMTITLNVENAVENATVTFDNIIVGTPEFAEKRLNAVSARIEGTTGIADNRYEATGIYTENGRIVIEATSDGVAEIVASDGIVRKVEITAGKNHIAVEQKGMFVVKVGNKIAKVVL